MHPSVDGLTRRRTVQGQGDVIERGISRLRSSIPSCAPDKTLAIAESGDYSTFAGTPYDVILTGARIDGTLDAEGDFKLERLMAAARPLGSRALPTQSLPPPADASGACPLASAAQPFAACRLFQDRVGVCRCKPQLRRL